MHLAYYRSVSNPFIKLRAQIDTSDDSASLTLAGNAQWSNFRRRVDEIARAVGATP
jgi:trafficking protein particle complex subunit 2